MFSKIRKIAAVAALTVAALAVPAGAAFASQNPFPNGGSQGGGCYRDDCLPPAPVVCHETVKWTESWTWSWRFRHPVPVWHRVVTWRCFPAKPECRVQDITFNMPADSAVITELSGPALYNGEDVTYNGQGYTVEDAFWHTFEVQQGGVTVVNGATAITDGTAQTVCQD